MPSSEARPPVLFLHIGWAREYMGGADDPILGKFGFIAEGFDHPGEALNFKDYDRRCYGYAPVGGKSINLRRLSGDRADSHVDGVLVIWTATDPAQGGRYVVGWYKDARVHATMQVTRPDETRPDFIVEAASKDCHVVPEDQRGFQIPRGVAGWPGISSAFFASDTLSADSLDQVQAYVEGATPSSSGFAPQADDVGPPDGSVGRLLDPELKARVETAAIAVVVAHYEAQGWRVGSVEKENCGWDLTATKAGGRWQHRIEVKGRQGAGAVELTPNEFAAMHAGENQLRYRLAVVHEALSPTPRLTVFAYRPGRGCWIGYAGEVLELAERTGAIARF